MYLIARTAKQRPTLQHKADEWDTTRTACGLDVTGWSRAYQDDPIPALLCKKCGSHRS